MKRDQIKILVETGIMLALAFILSYFRIGRLPQGGSISLQMIPIFLVALRWGVKSGIFAGVAFGILKILGPDPVIAHPIQALLDYPIAFGVIGVAGFFRWNHYLAIVAAGSLRFLSHFLAGVVFFSEYTPEGSSVIIYSLGYNASYMIPEIIIVILITPYIVSKLKDVPQTKVKEEKLIFLSLILPLLMITAFSGRVDNSIVKIFTENHDTQVLIMNIFKGIVTLGWLTVLAVNIRKFVKEKVKVPITIFVYTQLIVIIAYFVINNVINKIIIK